MVVQQDSEYIRRRGLELEVIGRHGGQESRVTRFGATPEQFAEYSRLVTRVSRLASSHLLAPATTITAAQLTGAVGSAGTVAATGTALLGGLIARHDTSPQVWVASFGLHTCRRRTGWSITVG